MSSKSSEDQKVDVNFESHPPIDQDAEGITNLLKQTFFQQVDCNALSQYLISLKEVTQVIALESPDEENTSDDEEPDDDIYGVSSVIDLETNDSKDDPHLEVRRDLMKFLQDKSPKVKELHDQKEKTHLALIVNERYINLPPLLSVPTLSNLTHHIVESKFTHLIFVSKILVKSKAKETELPSKKMKSTGQSSKSAAAEPLVYVNAEEEIVYESSLHHTDYDVSSLCDENHTWSFSSDVKYTPHRRIMIVDAKNWSNLLENLEKELN